MAKKYYITSYQFDVTIYPGKSGKVTPKTATLKFWLDDIGAPSLEAAQKRAAKQAVFRVRELTEDEGVWFNINSQKLAKYRTVDHEKQAG